MEALDYCIDYHGALPSWGALERFMRAQGLQLARKREPWEAIVATVRADRAARGRWTPPRSYPKHVGPDFSVIYAELELAAAAVMPAGTCSPRRRRKNWSLDDAIAAVVRFLDDLPAGKRPTQRANDDWAAEQEGEAPYSSMLGRLGGFVAVREIAEGIRRRPSNSC